MVFDTIAVKNRVGLVSTRNWVRVPGSDYKFTEHVDYVIKISNQRLYLLQQLRKQGLSGKCLDVVFCAIILSIITSAWGGYVTKDNTPR